MPAPFKIKTLKVGIKPVDDWIEYIVDLIKQALNISGGNGIAVVRSQSGTSISLQMPVQLYIAKAVSGTGIPARSGGNVPGSGNINIYSFDGSAAPVSIRTGKAYNLNGAAVGVSGNWMLVAQVQSRYWFVVVDVCS